MYFNFNLKYPDLDALGSVESSYSFFTKKKYKSPRFNTERVTFYLVRVQNLFQPIIDQLSQPGHLDLGAECRFLSLHFRTRIYVSLHVFVCLDYT